MPYGRSLIEVEELVSEIRSRGGYMIVGGADTTFDKHPKPHSLDIWHRNRAEGYSKDVRQTTREFLNEICSCVPLRLARDRDPVKGTLCKSLRLRDHAGIEVSRGVILDMAALKDGVEAMSVEEVASGVLQELTRTKMARLRFAHYDSERAARLRAVKAYQGLFMRRRLRRLGVLGEIKQTARRQAVEMYSASKQAENQYLRFVIGGQSPEEQKGDSRFENSQSPTWVLLPYGGAHRGFEAQQLVEHLQAGGRDHIIQGQQKCTLAEHTKPNSLDVWLRKSFAQNPDVKQAVNSVIDSLVATGLFEQGNFLCPDIGTICKGIRLVRRS